MTLGLKGVMSLSVSIVSSKSLLHGPYSMVSTNISGNKFCCLFSLQCLDFAATAHLIHLIFCTIYAGFPKAWSWWLLNLACMALMSVIGEFICMRTELKAIPVSVASVKSTV